MTFAKSDAVYCLLSKINGSLKFMNILVLIFRAATFTVNFRTDGGLVWLISRTFLANEHYFSLSPNQPTVLLAMAYQPNKPKRTGRLSFYTFYERSLKCVYVTVN